MLASRLLILAGSAIVLAGSCYAVEPREDESPVADLVTELREKIEGVDPQLQPTSDEFREAIQQMAKNAEERGGAIAEQARAQAERAVAEATDLADERMQAARAWGDQLSQRAQRFANSWTTPPNLQPGQPPQMAPAYNAPQPHQPPQLLQSPPRFPHANYPVYPPYPPGVNGVFTPTASAGRGLLDTAFELERIAHHLELGGEVEASDIVRRTAMELRRRARAADRPAPARESRGERGRGRIQGGPSEPPGQP